MDQRTLLRAANVRRSRNPKAAGIKATPRERRGRSSSLLSDGPADLTALPSAVTRLLEIPGCQENLRSAFSSRREVVVSQQRLMGTHATLTQPSVTTS